MPNDQRLRYQVADLQKQWDLLSQKLSKLAQERILETRTEEQFRLEHRIAEITAERAQLEQRLRELEQQGAQDTPQAPLLLSLSKDQDRPYSWTVIPKVYHNLPQPDYGRFVGREAELAKITRILQPYPHSQHAVVTIDGIGGIGKSALALEIGQRYLRNYDTLPPESRFDAIIWTSAKLTILTAEGIATRRQVLRTLDDIYNAIAVALQREDVTRARKEEQNEVVRNALTRQRTLLIVDNLETVDDEAVLDFLRELPAPTKAMVTTRHRLDVAYPVRLTGMPWEDAQLLIAQECEKKGVLDERLPKSSRLRESDARRLFDRTGGVPLAIVWSIAQMGFGYGVETVLNRLGQPAGDIARFCFEGAVERLRGKPAHKLLMVLSLCANDASREALGYATELPELDRDDGLVELEKLSLVNKQADRFSLLPLTKQYAAAELEKSAEKERLREKWIEYFRKLSEEYSSGYWNWKNYPWLLIEGDNILSIVDWAITTDGEVIVLSFTRAVMFYLVTGSWIDLISYGDKFSKIAQLLNDKNTWAWICGHWLGWVYGNQGNIEDAESFTRRSLSLYQELNDVKGICFAMNHLGRIMRLSGRYEDDKKICDSAMSLAQKYNDIDGISQVHLELGKLARDQGRLEESKIHLESVIDWCENHKDEADLDSSVLNGAIGQLGWAEFHLGNQQKGKELLERSFAFFVSLGGKGYTTTLHWRLAVIEKALDNRENALQHAQEAHFWAERLGMVRELEGAKALLNELEQP